MIENTASGWKSMFYRLKNTASGWESLCFCDREYRPWLGKGGGWLTTRRFPQCQQLITLETNLSWPLATSSTYLQTPLSKKSSIEDPDPSLDPNYLAGSRSKLLILFWPMICTTNCLQQVKEYRKHIDAVGLFVFLNFVSFFNTEI